MTDVLLINPSQGDAIYQGLDTAVEPPLWCRLIAGYLRDRGWDVAVWDQDVTNKSDASVPRLAVIVAHGHQPSASAQAMDGADDIVSMFHGMRSKVAICGGTPSALPLEVLRETGADYVIVGEGPAQIDAILKGEAKPGIVESAPLLSTDALHGNAWDLLPMDRYRAHNWQCLDGSPRSPYASIYTSLGCPFACLTGDTPVNTVYGDIPIAELAERYGDGGVPVYTYDPETREAFVADSVMIRKYQSNAELVRVHFDDGTHIDCTPDHRFLQFKWGNGKSPGKQWQCEAQDLPAGAHVRAIKFYKDVGGYTVATWGRRDRRHRARMVMDYVLGRPMRDGEQVHHNDHNRSNDSPDNLEFCATALEHRAHHPEVAERMRVNNPTRGGVSAEWRENLGAANRGKVRSPESRMRYRESKLGKKNPNYRHGKRTGTASRLAEINHRVVRVERLTERGDVYCLTVPRTGWFFANNVLVKNCTFCCINAPFGGRGYRMRKPADVVDEVRMLHDRYGVSTIKITDEMFVLNPKHYLAICEGLAALPFELNIWAYARIDTVKPDTLSLMRRAGIRWLALGIESGSAHVRDGASKRLGDDDIRDTVRAIEAAGINVIANYIFGLPDDTRESMRATLNLAKDLNTAWANLYVAQAYPGSRLYAETPPEHLPKSWSGYSQHSRDCTPLPTATLSAADVLAFRDEAFHAYFEDERYLSMLDRRFGPHAVAMVRAMTERRLERELAA